MQVLTLEHFASLLNEMFSVDLGEGQSSFTLVEAQPLSAPPLAGLARAPFSLLFHHPSAILFPQRIYQMTHARLGEFGIFLVPVARNREGFIYQAIFN